MYVELRKTVQMSRFAGQKLRHRCREQTYGHQGGKTTVGWGWWWAEFGYWDWHVYTDVYKIDDWFKKIKLKKQTTTTKTIDCTNHRLLIPSAPREKEAVFHDVSKDLWAFLNLTTLLILSSFISFSTVLWCLFSLLLIALSPQSLSIFIWEVFIWEKGLGRLGQISSWSPKDRIITS